MFFPTNITLQIKGKLYLVDRPWVMGIMNMTPDSFFAKSRLEPRIASVLMTAEKMIEEGADILDIGGYSSRPGAAEVSLEEEIKRTVPFIEAIRDRFPKTLISIDTFRSPVAKAAIESGADIVNDISSGELDKQMLDIVGKLGVPFIAMHMKGNPKTMEGLSTYSDITKEVCCFFSKKLEECRKFGIKDVIIDPGFGFAKTLEQNYEILRNLMYFNTVECLLLVGLSRKSMIYKKLGIQPEESLNGSTALHMFSLLQGANILRVHDVKAAKETIELHKYLCP
jgi:dihydropteroate synthase